MLVIQIEPDFERRLLSGVSADVQVIADGRNSNTAGTAMGYVERHRRTVQRRLARARGQADRRIRITTRAWYNPNLETRWHMIPALIGTLTLLQTLLLTGLSVAREREQGTFDQLLVTPFRPAEIMAGKALPPMLVGIVQATLVLLVAQLWFQIPFAGSFVTLYVGLGFFLLAAIGIGLLLSSVCGDHAAGDALFVSADHAVFTVIGLDHADQQHAGGSAVPHFASIHCVTPSILLIGSISRAPG